ncbi:MAG: hypothetical protein ACPGO3_12625 [Magnetospiraceae bacterium]
MSPDIDEAARIAASGFEAGRAVQRQQAETQSLPRRDQTVGNDGLVAQDREPEFLTDWEKRRDEAIGKIDVIEKSLANNNLSPDKQLERIDNALALAVVIARIAAARGDVDLAESIAGRANRLIGQVPYASIAVGNGIANGAGNDLELIKRKYTLLKTRIDAIVSRAGEFVNLVNRARLSANLTGASAPVEQIARTAEALIASLRPLPSNSDDKTLRPYQPTSITS